VAVAVDVRQTDREAGVSTGRTEIQEQETTA